MHANGHCVPRTKTNRACARCVCACYGFGYEHRAHSPNPYLITSYLLSVILVNSYLITNYLVSAIPVNPYLITSYLVSATLVNPHLITSYLLADAQIYSFACGRYGLTSPVSTTFQIEYE